MIEKNCKKWLKDHASYTSTYNVEILYSFNSGLQLKDKESQIKKTKHLLSEVRAFTFVTNLVLEFKKIENDDETKVTTTS